MKLRSGKITNPTTLDALIAQFKAYFAALESTPAGNFPDRVHICYDVYMLISKKLHIIDSPEFHPSMKFLTAVYNKTFDLESHLYSTLEEYIAEQQPCGSRFLYKKADELYDLLVTVRRDIKARHPEMKSPYPQLKAVHGARECDCNYCMDDY
jgi:hypothetical protein